MLGSGRRPALLRLGALLALAAVWPCAPAALRAGCGDYVVLGPAHQTRPTPSPLPPAPCHGPMCSGHSQPPAAPPSLAPPTPDQWGDLVRPFVPHAADGFAWLTVPDLRRHPGAASSVYHPPRAASATTSLS